MSISFIHDFRYGSRLQKVSLSIGDDLTVYFGNKCYPNCRFVKVTRKGFNILNLDTNRCILKKPVYAKGMANKEFASSGPISGSFWVSAWLEIHIKPKESEQSA